jgi:UDP-N-acetyl-D-mannosaminuronic acid transferase (WecB/TagA/CpsF family)
MPPTGTARQAIKSIYPDVHIVGVFSGFEHEGKLIVKNLSVAPSLVIAGMGALIQEILLLGLIKHGWTSVGFTCGGRYFLHYREFSLARYWMAFGSWAGFGVGSAGGADDHAAPGRSRAG